MHRLDKNSIKLCEPAPSGIIAPRIVPIRNNDEKISLRISRALVGYMSFNNKSSVSISEVCRSSASVAGWEKFYLDHIQIPEISYDGAIFLTPSSSPSEHHP